MKIIIFSGAGISAPSGIKTFRDSDGTWENHDIMEVCNYHTWKQNFNKVHSFYNDRREQLKDAQPNEAHNFIKELQDKYGNNLINITQNVDDLFERAGVKDTVHVHGNLTEIQCTSCDHVWGIGYNKINHKQNTMGTTKCPECDSNKIKPNIVFFGESAPAYHFAKRHLNSITSEDILIIIGTNGQVFPIDGYLEFIKANYSPTVILNNMEHSPYISSKFCDFEIYKSCVESIEQINDIIIRKENNEL